MLRVRLEHLLRAALVISVLVPIVFVLRTQVRAAGVSRGRVVSREGGALPADDGALRVCVCCRR